MKKPAETNHYDTLRVDRHASPQRVRHAWRRMAQKFHPDKHQGRGDSAALMARINDAYAVLSDPARRAAYDALLQPQAAPVSGSARAAALAMQDRFGWAGWLLLAIASIAVLTLGYPIQPWAEPARQARPVNEATEPVARLVRDGVITKAPARRAESAVRP